MKGIKFNIIIISNVSLLRLISLGPDLKQFFHHSLSFFYSSENLVKIIVIFHTSFFKCFNIERKTTHFKIILFLKY